MDNIDSCANRMNRCNCEGIGNSLSIALRKRAASELDRFRRDFLRRATIELAGKFFIRIRERANVGAGTPRRSEESFRQAGHESADTNGNYKCPARSFTHEGNTRGSLLRVRLDDALSCARVALAKERGGRRVSLTSLWIPAWFAWCSSVPNTRPIVRTQRLRIVDNAARRVPPVENSWERG
jgi:hypothetical protein